MGTNRWDELEMWVADIKGEWGAPPSVKGRRDERESGVWWAEFAVVVVGGGPRGEAAKGLKLLVGVLGVEGGLGVWCW